MKISSFFLLASILLIFACQSGKECQELTTEKALAIAKEIMNNETDYSFFNPDRLNELDTAVIFEGNFSSNTGKEYLAMCFNKEIPLPCYSFSHLPPPYETANYLIMSLQCESGEWKCNLAEQENKLEQNNIVDIDGDGINELVFEGAYDCNGGMRYGYYYIVSLKGNEFKKIYEKEPIDQITLLPNPEFKPTSNDTIRLKLKVQFEDVNNNGKKEIIEKTEYTVYKGGTTKPEIEKKAEVFEISDTLFLKDGAYKTTNPVKIIKQSTQDPYYETKKELTKLLLDFQDYLDKKCFISARTSIVESEYEIYFNDPDALKKAIKNGEIDEETSTNQRLHLDYSTAQVLNCQLLSNRYKSEIKQNKENGLDFSIYKDNQTLGSVLTKSEYGLEFRGIDIKKSAIKNREDFELLMQMFGENGFAPSLASIMASYDISYKEIYSHFIQVNSPNHACYYINYKLLKKAGEAPRLIVNFVKENDTWLIDDIYFDDFNGNELGSSGEYNNYNGLGGLTSE